MLIQRYTHPVQRLLTGAQTTRLWLVKSRYYPGILKILWPYLGVWRRESYECAQ